MIDFSPLEKLFVSNDGIDMYKSTDDYVIFGNSNDNLVF
jgi:hypothetical protein